MVSKFDDTIAAIATNLGAAGVSIIRISGEAAIPIAGKLFSTSKGRPLDQLKSRYLTNGWIVKEGKAIDEAMLCIMRGPNSFTAEDVVEIYCHGGIFITRSVLRMVLDGGARMALPGEFTQRAFVNGRIDLTRAEAVNDIIQAKSDLEVELVINQLKGKLYDKIISAKEDIAWILALINANIDFPEEDTIFTHKEEVDRRLTAIIEELTMLIGTADTGMKIKEGYNVVLTGQPNVGKSSILNGILGTDRAIVNQRPGTTRDVIEETFSLGGVPVSLVDTAGIHETVDPIEKEGIDRAIMAVKKADLVLWVVDGTNPVFSREYLKEFDLKEVPTVMVLNKKDLFEGISVDVPEAVKGINRVFVSAKSGEDIASLKAIIRDFVTGQTGSIPEMTALTNIRQKQATERCLLTIKAAKKAIDEGLGEEYLAVDLSGALSELGEIVGETSSEDMLNQIFSNFCIGK